MNLSEFYPTPTALVDKMLVGIDFAKIATVLEPSAGKGDIAAAVNNKLNCARNRWVDKDKRHDIDCIEIEENLRHILKGNNYRVVHDDFLTYRTQKRYDLIVMNPPFSNGDKHLSKALDMQEYGGKVHCILNAETLLNPCTNQRKQLVRRLEEYKAEIEYLSGQFESAERTTNVKIALVKVDRPRMLRNSLLLEHLKQAAVEEKPNGEPSALVGNDFLKAIIARYEFEAAAGARLIQEYMALTPYIEDRVRDNVRACPILELKLHDKDLDHDPLNGYVKALRHKYWELLFHSPEFVKSLTSNLQQTLHEKLLELNNYEFSYSNILSIQLELSKATAISIEDTILSLFDELSSKHAYDDGISEPKNIHYFDGWKTNKAWRINKKVIIPLNAFEEWRGNYRFSPRWRVNEKLNDIEKCLDFLSNGSDSVGLSHRMDHAYNIGQSSDIECRYFNLTFYKKGTCHITFTDLELLAKLNLFGSQRRGWLPPSYGKRSYHDMNKEEQTVIDSFEGEVAYAKVLANPQYYMINPARLLCLPGM